MADWLKVITKVVTIIPMVVNLVEKLAGDKKGKEKQDAAVDGIKDIVAGLEFTFGKEIVNEDKFQELVRQFIDTYVAMQNFASDYAKKSEKEN